MSVTSFLVTDGMGGDGVTVTDAGYNFILTRPASRFLVQNISSFSNKLVFGFNQIISGSAVSNKTLGSDIISRGIPEISAADAWDAGAILHGGNEQVIELPRNSTFGQCGLFSVWLLAPTGTTRTASGGVLGF